MTVSRADLRKFQRDVDAVQRALDDVPEQLRKESVWRQAVNASFKSIVSEAKGKTRRNTGQLRRTLKVWQPPSKQRYDIFSINFGYRAPRPFRKALAQEYGNVKVPNPSRAMTDTFTNHQDRLLTDMSSALLRNIEIVQNKLAAKLRRSRA